MRQSNGLVAVLAVIVIVLVLAPILYVASIGPAVWLSEKGIINADEGGIVVTFYGPLTCAADSNATVEAALKWYASLFAVSPIVTPQPAVYGPVAPPVAGVDYDLAPQGAGVPTQQPTIPNPN